MAIFKRNTVHADRPRITIRQRASALVARTARMLHAPLRRMERPADPARRAVVKGSAAAAALVIPLPAFSRDRGSSEDALVAELAERFHALMAEHAALMEPADRASERLKATWPPRPKGMEARGPADPISQGYHDNIKHLRAVIADPFAGLGLEGPVEAWDPTHLATICGQARERAEELLPLAEAYEAAVRRNFDESGYTAAAKALAGACDRLDEVAERIVALPFTSLPCLSLKALVLRDWDGPTWLHNDDTDDGDMDWDVLVVKRFINGLAAQWKPAAAA